MRQREERRGTSRSALQQSRPAAAARSLHELVVLDTESGFARLAEMLSGESVAGLDTETAFWDKDDHGDRGKLCLIQISLPVRGVNIIVDPILSVDAASKTVQYRDLSALAPCFVAAGVTWVAHNAQFEDEVLKAVGLPVAQLVDTQQMLRRLRPDLDQFSLRVACKYVLGIEVDKEQQKSEWHVRPLAPEQVHYAALDPELAYKLYTALRKIEQRAESFSALSAAEALRLLNEKLRALDGIIDSRYPELRELEAREQMIIDELRRRNPAGADPKKVTGGRIVVGDFQQEISLEKVRAYFAERGMSGAERAQFDAAFAGAVTAETSKSALLDAMKRLGPKNLGFASAAAIERYLGSFQRTPEPREVEITTSYVPKPAPQVHLNTRRSDNTLMNELADLKVSMLSTFRDYLDEIPALRFEIKALREHIEARCLAEKGEVSGPDGTATFKKRTRVIDFSAVRAEFATKFAQSLGEEGVARLLADATSESISRAALREVVQRPELAFLGLATSPSRREMWEQVSVATTRRSPTRVVPYL